MKTYVVPMFAVIRAPSLDEAEDIASDLQTLALHAGRSLYQDEALLTAEVEDDDSEEFHTVLDYCKEVA